MTASGKWGSYYGYDPNRKGKNMLSQLFLAKRHISWNELFANIKAFKKARAPIRGYVTTICFGALMECGFLEALAKHETVSIPEFAKEHDFNEDILTHICRYLHRMDYLHLRNAQVSLTQQGEQFWQNAKGVLHLFYGYEPLFSTLTSQLKNEISFDKELKRTEDEIAAGFSDLAPRFIFKIMASIIREENFLRIIDLGCAEIELGAYLAQENENIKYLGIDHSENVITRAKEKIPLLNLHSRFEVILWDIFDIEKLRRDLSDYDVVTAVDLFHGYFSEGEDKLIQLFQSLKKTFHKQKVLFSEICLPPHSRMQGIAYPYTEHEFFHDLTRQKSFKEGELPKIMEQSGYTIIKTWNLNKLAARVFILAE